MPYPLPTKDELLDRILTDYSNLNGQVDAEIYIRAACLASALWGAYKYQEYIARQRFPDTADSEYLDRHFWNRTGQVRNAGETDAELLDRLLDYLWTPPAGGNKYDYIKWARSIANVANAWCFPLAQGLGTVDVVIMSDLSQTGAEIPSTSARSGVATSVSAGKLIDSEAVFNAGGHAVVAGDKVENTTQSTSTTVVTVDSATQLALADDIFKYANDNYLVHSHCGQNSSVVAGKLIDSGADFQNATFTLKKGDIVENITDDTETTVVTVDSGTQLGLAADIFTASPKNYIIRSLCAQVKKHIDTVRPVTGSRTRVLPPTILTQAVTMSTGGNPNLIKIAQEIDAYMDTMVPGQTLYKNQLIVIAINNGATDANVTVPAADVVPTAYQMIRPGAVTVT